MKNGFILWLLLLLCGVAAGYGLGRHRAAPIATNAIATPPADLPSGTLPSTNANTSNAFPQKMSLADIEAQLLTFKAGDDYDFYRQSSARWEKLLFSVDVADLPEVLAF